MNIHKPHSIILNYYWFSACCNSLISLKIPSIEQSIMQKVYQQVLLECGQNGELGVSRRYWSLEIGLHLFERGLSGACRVFRFFFNFGWKTVLDWSFEVELKGLKIISTRFCPKNRNLCRLPHFSTNFHIQKSQN